MTDNLESLSIEGMGLDLGNIFFFVNYALVNLSTGLGLSIEI